MIGTIYKLSIFFLAIVFLASCKDKWDDHNAVNENALSENLIQLISADTSFSVFYSYLQKTGYDKLLAQSQMFTVWAPGNSALAELDQSIINDSAKLRAFVGNHIAYKQYSTSQSADSVEIKMINGKNLYYKTADTAIGGKALDKKVRNVYCHNGILHKISSVLYAKDNIWEYYNSLGDDVLTLQKYYLSLVSKVFDESSSTRTGTDPSTGKPVYDTVWAYKNVFLNTIADVSNEDSLYTFFVIKDGAFSKEYTKMAAYIRDTSQYSESLTKYYINYDINKDIVVRGKFMPGHLPTTLVSINGIQIPSSKIAIDSYYECSNGIVYVVSNFDIPIENKIPTVLVEGEDYISTRDSALKAVSVSLLGIRARTWASGGKDLMVPGGSTGHKTPYLNVSYRTPSYVYAMTYKVYWKAINDFQTDSFQQKIAIDPINGTELRDVSLDVTSLKYIKAHSGSTYQETYLGDYTFIDYRKAMLYLVANGTTGSAPNDPIVLDYLKLVPVIPTTQN
jgi:uncharacterized surface protein with fasciclin (FAS1) repeats